MAEVKRGTARNGVRYIIRDDLAATPGTAEYEACVQRQRRAAYAILEKAAKEQQAKAPG